MDSSRLKWALTAEVGREDGGKWMCPRYAPGEAAVGPQRAVLPPHAHQARRAPPSPVRDKLARGGAGL